MKGLLNGGRGDRRTCFFFFFFGIGSGNRFPLGYQEEWARWSETNASAGGYDMIEVAGQRVCHHSGKKVEVSW